MVEFGLYLLGLLPILLVLGLLGGVIAYVLGWTCFGVLFVQEQASAYLNRPKAQKPPCTDWVMYS